MSDHMDVSNLAAGMNESVIQLVLCLLTACLLDCFPAPGLIIRMDALQERLVLRLSVARIKTEYAVEFFRRVLDLVSHRISRKAAGVAESLRLRQITLALPQSILYLRPFAALCLQRFVGSPQLLYSFFQIIACAPQRFRSGPLLGAQRSGEYCGHTEGHKAWYCCGIYDERIQRLHEVIIEPQ